MPVPPGTDVEQARRRFLVAEASGSQPSNLGLEMTTARHLAFLVCLVAVGCAPSPTPPPNVSLPAPAPTALSDEGPR